MKILCDVCKNKFELSLNQRDFINESIKKDMNFIMLQCNICMNSFPVNPKSLDSNIDSEENKLRCPVEGCYGLVSKIDDFYGCGECGHVWKNKKILHLEILDIIRKYPYRAKVYDFSNSNDITSSKIEPKYYKDMINKELIK